ncbi:hypothetical protein ABIC56_002919 [Acinetobacter bereziniae]|uniref:hypothetical protein n=1 Tax=Acinetobacter bereziniae TaxID=106648 RepID=UPI0028633868|nr:hypothetical protein [Acinetobacter bereziniae]MDR6542944.1 hypothetical protein [Acinetobacter bereziniae]
MDKFEEWWKVNGAKYDYVLPASRDAFEAGQESRQAELDQLNEVLDERTKEWLEAIELGTYFQDVAKPLKDEVDFLKAQLGIKRDQIKGFESEIKKTWQALEEKDKRIEKATAKWISIVTILTTTDIGVPDAIFKQLDQLHDALCGMNEIGDDNANS